MKEIASFNVDHTTLLPGIYVSRKDEVGGEILTTFDLRIMRPYVDPPMDTGAIHSLEHLIAHFVRKDKEWSDKIIYFGPMGCRTGFDFIVAKDTNPKEINGLLLGAANYVIDFSGEIPGATKKECGNYLENNLYAAKYYMEKYKREVLQKK